MGDDRQVREPDRSAGIGDSVAPVMLAADISGLAGHSLYHYRVVAENTAATVAGDDRSFSIPGVSDKELPHAFALHQNYPNPFNPTTQIRYDLPVDATVVIRIFDLPGRQLQTLVSGPQSAGFHSVPFDARDLPSGIYLYRITAGSFTDTRKAVVIR